jgi:putative cell wall-binding protein
VCLTALVAALAVGLSAMGGAPAGAQQGLSGERVRTIPVWPGVQRAQWELTNAAGDPVRAQVARIAPDAPVDLRLAFGQGALAGLETVPSMARSRIDDGAVLGINGGFWRAFPFGRPDSFTVRDGRLVTEAETRGDPDYGRGALGLQPDGSLLVDRILPQDVQLRRPERGAIGVTGLNRLDRQGTASVPPDGEDALYLLTDQLGSTVTLPGEPDEPAGSNGSEGSQESPDSQGSQGSDGGSPNGDASPRGPATWRRVPGVTAAPSGQGQQGVLDDAGSADPGDTVRIPGPPGGLLVGYGDARPTVEGLTPGNRLVARTSLAIHRPVPGREADRWREVELALSGGPHIVRSGQMTGPSDWAGEGFGPAHHSRHARTAVGVTGDGTILLVTVDDSQEAGSVGMGTAELATFFQRLGATEALMLDGGGSSTMTQDTVVANRPGDGSPNPVANALFVQRRESLTASGTAIDTQRLAGSGRAHTAALVARAGFDSASHAVVAAGGDFPDALAGGPLAAVLDAPLLLATPDGVGDVTMETLADLGVERVTVLGGGAAVPDRAVDQLKRAGLRVDRAAGATRFSTAAEIARRVGADGPLAHDRVVLTSGLGFADALVAAAPAGLMRIPTLLAAPEQLPSSTRAALAAMAPDEIVVMGGSSAVSQNVARQAAEAAGARLTRLAGATRFATARAVNEWARDELANTGVLADGLDTKGLVTARGDRFPDALAGGPLAAQRGQLLMILPPWDVRGDRDAAAYLDERQQRGLQRVTLLGGFAALSSYQQWQLEHLAQ